MPNIYIAYGSESGNAQGLAQALSQQIEQQICPVQFSELNDIVLANLSADDTLLIITSSFGDGEPTGNAEAFYERLLNATAVDCQFAVFGLGDVSYPKFCGFSIDVDKRLRACGATAIAKRVDADTNFYTFFEQWSSAILSHFSGDSAPLKALDLQVKAYGENQSFPARIQAVRRLDSGDFPAYNITIGIAGSGINYQAGDLLYLLPPPNRNTLARLKDFYGDITADEIAELQQKELRHLGKPLFRALAKHTGNAELKALTKMSAAKKLADYCYGRDIADVLRDFCTPENLPLRTLLDTLSAQLPRAYSIASCGSSSPDNIQLCVREVAYQLNGNHYVGTASHFLTQSSVGDIVNIYVRDNPHFHLPQSDDAPIILIGAGVGIAPHLGFLARERDGEAHLFFGERHRDTDFLYQDELEQQLQNGHLTALHTAFSRDQTEKIYVQDRLREQGETLWQLLENQAEIYVCGSKANLGKNVDNALCDIAETHGGLSADDAKQWLHDLISNQRYHQDLY